ncbi:MAG: M20/M25/M40 family metallo-hydrolase, partial [Blastocatellia bacterium]
MKNALSSFVFFILIFPFAVSTIYAQKLAADEQKIVDYIDKQTAEAIGFLEKTVNIESPTEDFAGVKSVGMLMGKEFESLGMKVKWIEMPPEVKRAGHLIAEMNGTKGKRILILGHLDTVLRGEKFRR